MTDFSKIRTFSFLNDTGEEIPSFAAMIVTGVEFINNYDFYYKIRKATYEDEQRQDPARVVFSTGNVTADTEKGSCSLDFPCLALVDTSAGAAIGDYFGPVEDQWYLGPAGNAFILKAREESDPYLVGDIQTWLVESNVSESEIVRVTSASPDADGFYSGVVERLDPLTLIWSTVRTCKVRDVNA